MNKRVDKLLDRLPHRPPFRFLTDNIEFDGSSGRGIWRVTGDEFFFKGHFPGAPIVPGVLVGEALAQLSGLVVTHLQSEAAQTQGQIARGPGTGKLAHIELRFNNAVSPPADILLASQFQRSLGALWQFDVEARLGEASVARGGLTLAIDATDSPVEGEGA